MKKISFLIIALFSLYWVNAQEVPSDTIRVGGMIIIKKKDDKGVKNYGIKPDHSDEDNENEQEDAQDKPTEEDKKKNKNITTNWWVMDLGLSQFNDLTDYNSGVIQNPSGGFAPGANKDWFKLRNSKSINVNLWIFIRKINLISHVANLKYGLGLEMNNYRFSNPVIFQSNPTKVVYVPSTVNSYSKNKLVANYLTLPAMLNLNLTPKNKKALALSAGMSIGYLCNSHQKTISSVSGKQKNHDSFDLEPWKISYIGELNLGIVKLYGSVATKSMFAKAFNMVPYTVGFRFSN